MTLLHATLKVGQEGFVEPHMQLRKADGQKVSSLSCEELHYTPPVSNVALSIV
jgi:hypothetical protein